MVYVMSKKHLKNLFCIVFSLAFSTIHLKYSFIAVKLNVCLNEDCNIIDVIYYYVTFLNPKTFNSTSMCSKYSDNSF